MQIEPSQLLKIAAFALATLGATGALVAAGLNDDAAPPAVQAGCNPACNGSAAR